METNARIYVAGHTGTVGSAVVRMLEREGMGNVFTATRRELDLLDQQAVAEFFRKHRPEYVIVCAARVGGIAANMAHPALFLYENLCIQNNIIWPAHVYGVRKLLFLGSSCIYPREAPQPMSEECLLTGRFEPTNEGYAVAKIVGIKLCEYISEEFGRNFISCVPTNIYGENDNWDPASSHIIPALMRRMHEAKVHGLEHVVVWGDGSVRREFLYVDDLARAILFLCQRYDERQFLNVGTGEDVTVRELAHIIKNVTGYAGELVFDASKPGGMPRRLLDVSRIHQLGWRHSVNLEEGLRRTYAWFQEHVASGIRTGRNTDRECSSP